MMAACENVCECVCEVLEDAEPKLNNEAEASRTERSAGGIQVSSELP